MSVIDAAYGIRSNLRAPIRSPAVKPQSAPDSEPHYSGLERHGDLATNRTQGHRFVESERVRAGAGPPPPNAVVTVALEAALRRRGASRYGCEHGVIADGSAVGSIEVRGT